MPVTPPPATPTNASDYLLELTGVTVRYGPTVAVRELSLEVARGEIVTLLGANGAGKSSTLNAIVGLAPVVGGRVLVAGRDVTGRPPESIIRHRVALVPEGRRIFANLTAAENLRLGAATTTRAEYERRLPEVLDLFPVVKDRLDSKAGLFPEVSSSSWQLHGPSWRAPAAVARRAVARARADHRVGRLRSDRAAPRSRGDDPARRAERRACAQGGRPRIRARTGSLDVSGDADSLASQSIEEAYLGIAARSS